MFDVSMQDLSDKMSDLLLSVFCSPLSRPPCQGTMIIPDSNTTPRKSTKELHESTKQSIYNSIFIHMMIYLDAARPGKSNILKSTCFLAFLFRAHRLLVALRAFRAAGATRVARNTWSSPTSRGGAPSKTSAVGPAPWVEHRSFAARAWPRLGPSAGLVVLVTRVTTNSHGAWRTRTKKDDSMALGARNSAF